MNHTFILKLHPEARLETLEPNAIRLVLRGTALRLTLSGAVKEVLEALTGEGVRLSDIAPANAASIRYLILKLDQKGMVAWRAGNALSLVPMTADFRASYRALKTEERVRASRFALVRVEEGRLLLESPLSHAKIWIENPLYAALWGLLATPKTSTEIALALSASEEEAREALELLVMGGMAEPTDAEGKISEDKNETLRLWSHHEALFHARSRMGRHDSPTGAQFSFVGEIEHAPAHKPPLSSEPIALSVPNGEVAEQTKMPLLRALEARHSTRHYDATNPLTIEQLSHFLYWTSRSLGERVSKAGVPYAAVLRQYPNGGSMGELEVYVIVRECAGVVAGAYHYDSWDHALRSVEGDAGQATEILQKGQWAAGITEPPPVMLVLAARTPRFLWKYQSMGYACILKHVGVVFQTWYLVATAMGLAACANGAGNSEVFSKLTGYSFFDETSVGEFMLGVPPHSLQAQNSHTASAL